MSLPCPTGDTSAKTRFGCRAQSWAGNSRFLGSPVFETDLFTDLEPGIPGGGTPASTDARHMKIRVWTEWKDSSVRREPAG